MKIVMRIYPRGWAGAALFACVLSVPAVAPISAQDQEIPSAMHGAEMRWKPTFFVLFEKLELVAGTPGTPIGLDVVGFYGGDRNRVWFRSEGEVALEGGEREAQFELLYGRLIGPFWDALVGLRADGEWAEGETNSRLHLAAGIQGLAPGWFEVEASVFLSQDADLSARLTSTYDLYFTQRLVLEPQLELNVAFQDAPEFGIGSGLSELELGGRLRYEIRRKFAPYIGLSWSRSFGDTETFARAAGEDVSGGSLVAGARVWY